MEDRFNNSRRFSKAREKERIHKRYNPTIDPENYQYIPEKKQVGYYDEDVHQRVAIYVRVSTDDIRQTTSYELQKRYYEEFVDRHPNWTLVDIYADEGISGTSLKHRDAFNQMINDSKQGKIDMIITKSVSRFARNVEDFIGTVRNLAELRPHVGVFFESEAIFSLNDDSQMALTFQATMAEEESHIRSRSMEASLRMRLDHGIPLTPKLYGYTHDEDGELIINPEEAPYVKLMFYMYLYQHEADIFANQQKYVKSLLPYEIFMANIEAGSDEQLIIKDLVESYGMKIWNTTKPGCICAVSTLESIYEKYGYHVLNRCLRLIIGTWEGDPHSFTANIMNGITRMIVAYGDQLNDKVFKEKLGAISVKQLSRTAKERNAGSLGYAEAMVLEYNGKKKPDSAYRLPLSRLHSKKSNPILSAIEEQIEVDIPENDAQYVLAEAE